MPPEVALTTIQLAEVLAVTPETVRRYVAAGVIPCITIGRTRRFFLSEVRAALSAPRDSWAPPSRRKLPRL
ncbi:helix-turn-helix domain-containing protein [Curtobacterium sp. MCPF17_046]|uniref:helix-turn-helix domain-containing protein n=1 Tax=Curtobacterium sp. MCPF17_046 TaxID=2175663 RepID=UPI000D9FB2B9|nr:helix-turn-helix domain-containing protein [Curtobacterium sp. MCPF17_046]PYY38837.1 hypothetical protein DEJ32_10380 [Curtobacterium sp. MCPF17_046]